VIIAPRGHGPRALEAMRLVASFEEKRGRDPAAICDGGPFRLYPVAGRKGRPLVSKEPGAEGRLVGRRDGEHPGGEGQMGRRFRPVGGGGAQPAGTAAVWGGQALGCDGRVCGDAHPRGARGQRSFPPGRHLATRGVLPARAFPAIPPAGSLEGAGRVSDRENSGPEKLKQQTTPELRPPGRSGASRNGKAGPHSGRSRGSVIRRGGGRPKAGRQATSRGGGRVTGSHSGPLVRGSGGGSWGAAGGRRKSRPTVRSKGDQGQTQRTPGQTPETGDQGDSGGAQGTGRAEDSHLLIVKAPPRPRTRLLDELRHPPRTATYAKGSGNPGGWCAGGRRGERRLAERRPREPQQALLFQRASQQGPVGGRQVWSHVPTPPFRPGVKTHGP